MELNPHALTPNQLTRLVNATPLGCTASEARIYRHRHAAGAAIGDGRTIDLIRYVAWLFVAWWERRHPVAPAGEAPNATKPTCA